jgi:hypothetical protein
MTDMTGSSTASGPSSLKCRLDLQISVAVSAGVILAIVGLVDGLVMAFHRKVAQCANGTTFPVGADPVCYVHPQSGGGIAIVAFSTMLGIVIALCGIVARATVSVRSSADGS